MLLREELLLLLRLAELLRFDELLETLDELLRLDELFRLDEPLDTFDELFRLDELVRAVLVALLFLLLSLRDTLLLLLREVLLPLLPLKREQYLAMLTKPAARRDRAR